MLVKIYKDRRDRICLHIGEANARRYFSRLKPSIELKLDDLRIRCTLPPDFWQGCPDIQDPRLSGWLEFKVGRRAAAGEPSVLSMVPSGGGETFVVRPHRGNQPESFGAEVTRSRHVQSEHMFGCETVRSIEVQSVA